MKPIDFRVIEENMKLRAHQYLFLPASFMEKLNLYSPSEARFLNHKNIGKEDDILLISGIAVPTPFIREAEKYSNKVLPVVFPDHHTFSKSDFKKLDVIFEKMTSPGKLILVTEKDAARLKKPVLLFRKVGRNIYIIYRL